MTCSAVCEVIVSARSLVSEHFPSYGARKKAELIISHIRYNWGQTQWYAFVLLRLKSTQRYAFVFQLRNAFPITVTFEMFAFVLCRWFGLPVQRVSHNCLIRLSCRSLGSLSSNSHHSSYISELRLLMCLGQESFKRATQPHAHLCTPWQLALVVKHHY